MKRISDYTFSYNCKVACQSPSGMKRKTIQATNITEARIKIKNYLKTVNGTLCIEFF